MQKFKAWLYAARLRTLPLSLSGIFVGTAIAGLYGYTDTTIFALALLTTVGFQVTSNFANDYGDGTKGTDNESRIGPKRALQSGILTKRELKNGILVSIGVNFLLITALLFFSFSKTSTFYIILFSILGLASIWAALKYTMGDSAYGYRGLGDVFVFCFFGLLAVLGSLFLYTKFLTPSSVLPAMSIGFLSTAVLNLNNLRDAESDQKSKKNTLIVKLGPNLGKRYHYLLLFGALASISTFILYHYDHWSHLLCLLAFIPIALHSWTVYQIKNPILFDPELKKLALSTFLLAVLFYIGFQNFL